MVDGVSHCTRRMLTPSHCDADSDRTIVDIKKYTVPVRNKKNRARPNDTGLNGMPSFDRELLVAVS
jgi:hypothetical protein